SEKYKQHVESRRRYEETEKSFALGLYYHSPVAYRFMKNFLCLPDVRSLRRWLEGLDVSRGINQNILNILKLKFQTAPIREKLVSIITCYEDLERRVKGGETGLCVSYNPILTSSLQSDKILGFYQNCRGHRTKLTNLICNICTFSHLFIVLTETWLNNNFNMID
ncbi:Uncharacterized protein FWK35_00025208, partial [Aphis craccivora]